MSRASYEHAGLAHTKGDHEATWGKLEEAQKEVNGHVSMLIKVFKMGESWENNVDRIRETMLGEGLSVCPITLLFKDHKGWKNTCGSVPPTRHVAGGHVGLNMNLSEIVSDVLEPMVGTLEGGFEVISTEDMVANIEGVNSEMVGWTKSIAWEGVVENNLIAARAQWKMDS